MRASHLPRCLVAGLWALLALAACVDNDRVNPATENPAVPSASELVDQSIERFLDDAWPKGAGGKVLAVRGREIEHCEGIGWADREAKIAARCDTVYDIMSMTKQFTAAAILKLEMMGKLRVSDPVRNFLGPVPDDQRDITVHQLLTHTAGLVDTLGGDYDALTRSHVLRAGFVPSWCRLRGPSTTTPTWDTASWLRSSKRPPAWVTRNSWPRSCSHPRE
jgi:CubicO group peptidase (beta-lactamase class C family)